jgi:regulator of cell morphogenesis and NO signaling
MRSNQLQEITQDMACENYQIREVFGQLGIDIVDDSIGKLENVSKEIVRTLEQVRGIQKQKYEENMVASWKFKKWDIDFIIEKIIKIDHLYIKDNAVTIYVLAQKVVLKYSENHPELKKLNTALFLFLHDLLNQVKKKEQIFLPIIKQLAKKMDHSEFNFHSTFYFIKDFVIGILKENLAICKYLKLFHKLTSDYILHADSNHSYRYLFIKMKEFEDVLIHHIRLENNILFPNALSTAEESGNRNT